MVFPVELFPDFLLPKSTMNEIEPGWCPAEEQMRNATIVVPYIHQNKQFLYLFEFQLILLNLRDSISIQM